MSRSLSYVDAVKLLGGRNNQTVAALDRLTGGLVMAASAAGIGLPPGLVDARAEVARLSGQLVAGLGERLSGLSRFDRSERLAAAHAVVVVTAYFEALAETELPLAVEELEFTRTEQVAVAVGTAAGSDRLGGLAEVLLHADVPLPIPQRSSEATLEALHDFYEQLSGAVLRFVRGLVVWDRLDETRQVRLSDTLRDELPEQAAARYEALFRRLAADFPEVAFWANRVEHQATREQIRRLGRGLAGLEQVLSQIAAGRLPDERRTALTRAYQAALTRPILSTGDTPEGLRIPALGVAYVSPDFRAAEGGPSGRLAEESWWDRQPDRDDLQGFLLGHLTSPQATRAPLLVLGQPGAGKSVLTRMLAARLPSSQFLVVRVALRDTPAEADLQAQIEHAIRAATGEHLTWPELARTAEDALPVVLLDGFDELLQATGVSQSDYLEKVAHFQQREADHHRPVAVLVTSRTAVADRARPTPGMVAVRLEPFRDDQIAQWLGEWNLANASFFAAHGLRPLRPESLEPHAELAAEPLLLSMLALYDADGNALQRENAQLGQGELYERLLNRFAQREVSKTGGALTAAQATQRVERELLRLSVAAFGMFNRGRQWVTDTELDADLLALLGDSVATPGGSGGFRANLTAADVVLGRFFFVHEAQAIRDERRLHTYEFLHATFGEYLIARLVARELGDLGAVAELNTARSRPSPPDDDFLYALLSFQPLTARSTVVSFLAERLQTLPKARRDVLRGLLLELFHDALHRDVPRDSADYAPARAAVPARCATYAANLVLLAVLTGGEISGRELFTGPGDMVDNWRSIALLWRSQLPPEGWRGLISTLAVDRLWNGDRRDLRVRLSQAGDAACPPVDPYWTYAHEPGSEFRGHYSWMHHHDEELRMQSHFLCDPADDIRTHALEPLTGDLGRTIVSFAGFWEERCMSAANALLTLWLTTNQDPSPEELASVYDVCLPIAVHSFAPHERIAEERYRVLILRQLAADWQRLPAEWLHRKAEWIRTYDQGDPTFTRLASEILPNLMNPPPAEQSTSSQ